MAPTKHFALSFENKEKILDRLERGVHVVTLASEYGVNESTIYTIRKNKDKICAAFRASNATTSKSILTAANVVLAKTEQQLLSYLDRHGRVGIGVDNKFLHEKAISFYAVIVARMPITDPQTFQASKGWLQAPSWSPPQEIYGLLIILSFCNISWTRGCTAWINCAMQMR